MLAPRPLTLERRAGLEPGPRVRPRRDRWTLDPAWIEAVRARGGVPVGVPPAGDGPTVLVTMDRGPDADPGVRLSTDYVDAVLHGGGRPVLVPPGERQLDVLLDAADALVITGGAFDIHPRHYGQAVRARLDLVLEDRTTLELALARAAVERGLPVLGVCGGLQVLAVACGGTLVQDLPPSPTHEQPTDPATPWHDVHLTGRLATWLGASVRVNSTHHQAIDDPGALAVAGRSPDGVIEAAEHPDHPFALGVQWHPERLGDARLYRALVEQASR